MSWTVVRENHENCWKTEFSKELGHQNQQIRFADANRPPEVIRTHGFPLSSKSNTIAQRAKLKGRQPWTMWAEFLEKSKIEIEKPKENQRE